MVRHLLPLLTGVLLSWGCLLSNPPDYDDVGSHPLVITQYSPPWDNVSIDVESTRPITVFRSWVRDENLGDAVWFRWYLDYDPDAAACWCLYWGRAPNLGGGEYLAEIGLDNRRLTPGKCHRLTVVVSDREWLDGLVDEPGCPQAVEGAHRVANDWWIGAFSEAVPVGEIFWQDCLALGYQNPLADPAEETTP